MESQPLNDMSDEKIQELVVKLSADVRERQTEVDTLQTSMEKLRVGISHQQQVRQKLTQQLFKAEQVVPLLESNQQLTRELEDKQTLLKELSAGQAKDQRLVLESEERLTKLRNKELVKPLKKQNEICTSQLKDVESRYKEAIAAYQSTKSELERVQGKVSELKTKQRSSIVRESRAQSLDQQVDRILLKYCKEVDMKLTN